MTWTTVHEDVPERQKAVQSISDSAGVEVVWSDKPAWAAEGDPECQFDVEYVQLYDLVKP